MADYYEYSIPELVRILGMRLREYRMRVGLTQKELSEKAAVTVTTIHKIESGAINNMSLGTFLLLLKAIGILEDIDKLLPELPESPYMYRNKKKIQRIHHNKE